MLNLITPDWPAPANIKAFTTTRAGGYSQAPFDSFNLAKGIGEDEAIVARNRLLLKEQLQLPSEPRWLQQVHGIQAIQADLHSMNTPADASFTRKINTVCVVTTADCLPLLVCDRAGTCVAAIHAGWKGLSAGVIEATLKALAVSSDQLLVWLSPAIGPQVFEVGDEVYQQFVAHDAQASLAFKRKQNNRWLADIYLLAQQRLNTYGVTQISGGDFCTYSNPEQFYSYRRNNITGRMASLIWLTETP